MTVPEWITSLVSARSKILIEHRVANELGRPLEPKRKRR